MSKLNNNPFLNFFKKIFSSKIDLSINLARVPRCKNREPTKTNPVADNLLMDQSENPNELALEQFTIIDDSINHNEIISTVVSEIDPMLLENITKLQELAYKHDKTGMPNIECCVCLETNVRFMPLLCAHELCITCYNDLVTKSYTTCPLCREIMERIRVNKFYTIISRFDYAGIVITYLPPMFDENNNIWKTHEVFYDCNANQKQTNALIDSIKKLNTENYTIVPNSCDALDFFKSIKSLDIKKMTIINAKN